MAKEIVDKEKEQMKKQLEEMQKMLNAFMSGANTNISKDADRDVLFISLSNGMLNLSTEGYGQGVIYTFEEFGEEQTIPYSDAKLLIKNNRTFIEGGLVYIADDELIKSSRLTNVYKKILDKDGIFELLTQDKKKFTSIFSAMTVAQQGIVSDMVQLKLYNNEDVDMNIVQIINDTLKIDIISLVKNAKDTEKLLTENTED